MTNVQEIVARLQEYSLEALTQEQFNKWDSTRKRKYLKDHPHSKFENSGKPKKLTHEQHDRLADKNHSAAEKFGRSASKKLGMNIDFDVHNPSHWSSLSRKAKGTEHQELVDKAKEHRKLSKYHDRQYQKGR